MTMDDAYKIIGVPRSTDLKRTEMVYQQKSRKLRFSTLPGNTATQRQRALGQLVELTNAWDTIRAIPSGNNDEYEPRKTVAKSKTSATPRPISNPPQNMGDYWELFFTLIPFPRSMVAIVMASIVILIIILITQIAKGV